MSRPKLPRAVPFDADFITIKGKDLKEDIQAFYNDFALSNNRAGYNMFCNKGDYKFLGHADTRTSANRAIGIIAEQQKNNIGNYDIVSVY